MRRIWTGRAIAEAEYRGKFILIDWNSAWKQCVDGLGSLYKMKKNVSNYHGVAPTILPLGRFDFPENLATFWRRFLSFLAWQRRFNSSQVVSVRFRAEGGIVYIIFFEIFKGVTDLHLPFVRKYFILVPSTFCTIGVPEIWNALSDICIEAERVVEFLCQVENRKQCTIKNP